MPDEQHVLAAAAPGGVRWSDVRRQLANPEPPSVVPHTGPERSGVSSQAGESSDRVDIGPGEPPSSRVMESRPEPNPTSLLFEVCRPSDVQAMCRMLAHTFARNDPPAVAVGLTPAEFEEFIRRVSAPDATRELTIVARDPETGTLAGAMLTEDAASPPPDGMTELSPKFDPIFDIFGLLDAQLEDQEPAEPGDALHLFLLGVDDRFAGQGVGQRLVLEALENGIARGYRSAIVEATNLTSQHIFRKLGFATRAQTSYAAYRRDGVPIFATIADHGGPMSMIRDLGSVGSAAGGR